MGHHVIGRAKKFEVVTSLLVQFDENVPTLASEYQKAEAVLEELKVTSKLNLSDFEYLAGQTTYYQDQNFLLHVKDIEIALDQNSNSEKPIFCRSLL